MNYLENDIMKLRSPEPSDLEILYKWENDADIWVAGTTFAPYSKHILSKYIESAQLDIFETKQLRLMIDLKTEKVRTIGIIDLFDFDPFHHRAGVGILIGEINDRRKGYASVALQLLINYCFKLLGMHQLYCNIGADNIASLNLFKKHDFKIIGLKKEWIRWNDRYTDEYLLQLINA